MLWLSEVVCYALVKRDVEVALMELVLHIDESLTHGGGHLLLFLPDAMDFLLHSLFLPTEAVEVVGGEDEGYGYAYDDIDERMVGGGQLLLCLGDNIAAVGVAA